MVAMAMAQRLHSPFLRMGFNSLGAGASVNHLHFQLWEFRGEMPCEMARLQPLEPAAGAGAESAPGHRAAAKSRLHVRYTRHFPVKFLRFDFAGVALRRAAQAVIQCANLLINREVPFNLVMLPTSIMLFPRRPLMPLGSIKMGFPEVGGLLYVSDPQQFAHLTPEELEAHLAAHLDSADKDFDALLDAARDAVAAA